MKKKIILLHLFIGMSLVLTGCSSQRAAPAKQDFMTEEIPETIQYNTEPQTELVTEYRMPSVGEVIDSSFGYQSLSADIVVEYNAQKSNGEEILVSGYGLAEIMRGDFTMHEEVMLTVSRATETVEKVCEAYSEDNVSYFFTGEKWSLNDMAVLDFTDPTELKQHFSLMGDSTELNGQECIVLKGTVPARKNNVWEHVLALGNIISNASTETVNVYYYLSKDTYELQRINIECFYEGKMDKENVSGRLVVEYRLTGFDNVTGLHVTESIKKAVSSNYVRGVIENGSWKSSFLNLQLYENDKVKIDKAQTETINASYNKDGMYSELFATMENGIITISAVRQNTSVDADMALNKF